MYAKNVLNLFKHLYPVDKSGTVGSPDFNDEITKGACITHNGEITQESIRNAIEQGGN